MTTMETALGFFEVAGQGVAGHANPIEFFLKGAMPHGFSLHMADEIRHQLEDRGACGPPTDALVQQVTGAQDFFGAMSVQLGRIRAELVKIQANPAAAPEDDPGPGLTT
jgi:hypothetical protein